jgi:hypothetical protein
VAKAISFPETPDRPPINAELKYRLEYARRLLLEIKFVEQAQAHEDGPSAWTRAGQDWRTSILLHVFESIDEIGPSSTAARNVMRRHFVDSCGDFGVHFEKCKLPAS